MGLFSKDKQKLPDQLSSNGVLEQNTSISYISIGQTFLYDRQLSIIFSNYRLVQPLFGWFSLSSNFFSGVQSLPT